jgi:hypothetical protein
VIELILGRYEPLPADKPGKKPRVRRRRDPYLDLDLGDPLDMGDDKLA